MKYFFVIFLAANLISSIISIRRHNTNERYTKILDKIKPNSELCNEDICPLDRGSCSGENFCFCFDGYLSTFESPTLCDYEQKDRVLYFLFEFVLSFGIGHFYVGNYIYGAIKFVCYALLLGYYFLRLSKIKGSIDARRKRLFVWVLISIWQFIDGMNIFLGKYHDGNGKETGFKYF